MNNVVTVLELSVNQTNIFYLSDKSKIASGLYVTGTSADEGK